MKNITIAWIATALTITSLFCLQVPPISSGAVLIAGLAITIAGLIFLFDCDRIITNRDAAIW